MIWAILRNLLLLWFVLGIFIRILPLVSRPVVVVRIVRLLELIEVMLLIGLLFRSA